jgi:pimeloyl-ACP methyl ester carboxylesterase
VSEAAEPIGTVFLLSSLSLLTAGESKLIKAFHERGWTVVVVTPCLDILSLNHLHVPHEIPPSLLGKRINNHLAERAYASESAWSLLAKRRPKHKALPKVICGVSLGALAAPAVALRLQDAEALITIGGGAHVPAIMANSALRMLSMPSASQRRSLSQRMLREVPLDPGLLAPRLDLPVLQIDGMLDTIIPKRFANRWHEALGKPDRWRYPVGHVLLIEGVMPLQTNRLLDWVATATED